MVVTVPSWVIPGTYRENLVFLADQTAITGVELLFFLYDGEVKALLDTEWPAIREYARRFTFTVHLPDRVRPEHEELVGRLFPYTRHFIVHPPLPGEAEALGGLLRSWAGTYGKDRLFLLENTLPGRLEALEPHLPPEAGFCMDTGHLLLEGRDPAAFFKRHRDRIGEIHLHGTDRDAAARDGRLPDHRPINAGAPWVRELLPCLAGFAGVVNLEVFSWEEAERSLSVLTGRAGGYIPGC
jgi:hypothetical protein